MPADKSGTVMAGDVAVVEGERGWMCAGSNDIGGDPKQVMFMPLARDSSGNWQV